jgi:hypothetical protein
VTGVSDLRTGAPVRFVQAAGRLTIQGIEAWDQYDTVFVVHTAGRVGAYPTGTATATATASANGFPARNLTDGDYLTYWDSNTTLPVSVTLDLGAPRQVSYLAVNQREWSPTYNRETFGRVEDSARIKNYTVSVSADGTTWSDPVVSAVLPSVRAVQYIDLPIKQRPRYVRLTVLDTWAAASVPRYYRKLQIDEMWAGWGNPEPAASADWTYQAEDGTVGGFAQVVDCAPCSGGRKVTGLGNDAGNDVTVKVTVPAAGDYLLTMVGAVAGTRSWSVSLDRGPALAAVPMTGSSDTVPLLARSLRVHLHAGINALTFGNDTGYAPDLDRITVSPM